MTKNDKRILRQAVAKDSLAAKVNKASLTAGYISALDLASMDSQKRACKIELLQKLLTAAEALAQDITDSYHKDSKQ